MARLIRWGILGAGTVSRQFALCLRLVPDTRVVAVASRTPEHAEQFAAELGIERHYSDYEALLANSDVDVVYIATPAGLHHEHALLAVAHGKAVVCEKPFTTSAALAHSIVDAARKARVFCMEAMWMRFIPLVRELKRRLLHGDIGEVRLLQAELGFPIPYRAGSRYYDPALGGGSLLDLGIYPLSLAYYLLGPPTAAVALQSRAASGVDEQVAIVLSYPNALASLSSSFANRARNNAFVLGTGGQIELHPPLYAPTAMTVTRSAAARSAAGSPRRFESLVDRIPKLVELRRRLSPALKPLVRRNRQRITQHFTGFGYQFEAAEVGRCLRAGELESSGMPLDETVAILETLDRLRAPT